MRTKLSNKNKLIASLLSVGSLIIIAEGQKWSETILYSLAITITVYSYLVALGIICSISIYAIWSVINNLRTIARLKVENLEMMKQMTKRMDEFNNSRKTQPSNI
jgi:presenilin-like A22 family membrane protease